MSQARYLKLVEFAAHAGDVRCVRIGRKTAGVLVTGGDDKKVNVWAIGKTTASFSLSGHQSSVESVIFDREELVVAAGASNGSIKLFELQSARVTRSMGGHRSNVISLEWHPYESTLISGSMDTNVKLWNMRDKDAVATFKGHNAGVTHVKFSPDGNWVASASADGAVKIWDVRAGRLVTDLCPPTKYEITGLEFSPTEYVLATSARDKVVRFWDLENFSCIDQTTPEATPVRNIAFYTDGRYMFSALQDGCRVWSVEPPVQQDYVDVPWYRVSDLTVSTHRGQQRLIACSFNSTMVGLFYVTLRNVRPFNEDPNFIAREQGASVDGNPYAGAGGGGSRSSLAAAEAGMRKVSLGEPRGGTSDRPPRPEAASSALQPSNGRPPVPGPAVQSSSGSGIGRSVERSQVSAGRPPAPAPSASQQQAAPSVSLYPPHQQQSASSSRYAGADYGGLGDSSASDMVAARGASGQGAGPKAPMVSVGVGVGDSLLRGQPLPGAGLPADPGPLAAPPPAAPVSRSRPYTDRQREPQIEIHAPPHPSSRQQHDPYGAMGGGDGRYQWQGAGQGVMGDRGRERPGLGPGPGGAGSGFPDYEPAAAAYVKAGPSDLEAASQLQSGHGSFLAAMKKRAHALGLIRNFAAKGDWRGAINCARRCDDQSAFADLLSVMLGRREGFTLDLVSEVVSVVEIVLSLSNERQVQVGLDAVAVQLRCFGPMIRELCSPGSRGVGVGIDLSFEERRERANKARLALQNLVPKLNAMSRQGGMYSSRALDLASQLSQL